MILLFRIAEESADVTMRAQLRAGEINRIFFLSTNDVHCGVLSVLERLFSLAKSLVSVRQPTWVWYQACSNVPRSLRMILAVGPDSLGRKGQGPQDEGCRRI